MVLLLHTHAMDVVSEQLFVPRAAGVRLHVA
jgi:hypothetical protein